MVNNESTVVKSGVPASVGDIKKKNPCRPSKHGRLDETGGSTASGSGETNGEMDYAYFSELQLSRAFNSGEHCYYTSPLKFEPQSQVNLDSAKHVDMNGNNT